MSDQENLYSPAEIRHRIGASGSFTLNNVSGDVRVRGVAGDEVVARARWEGGGDQPLPLVVRRSQGSLQIDTEESGNWFSWRRRGGIEFDVSVPFGARVEVQVVSSDLNVQGLSGDQSYKSVSGDITIEAGGGRVAGQTVSGDIQVLANQPVEANLTTTSGDVEAGAPVFNALRMRTVSGDASVHGGFAEGAQHSVESVSGDLQIQSTSGLTVDSRRGLDFSKKDGQPMVAGDGRASLRFRSLSGDVHLETSGAPMRGSYQTGSREPDPEPQMSQEDSMEILRALERGEIDVEEASRRLEGAGTHG
jgi:hypothetical protein